MYIIGTVLTCLLLLAFVVLNGRRMLARQRGKALRNIAIWLGIFLALALVYKYVGPGHTAAPAQMEALPPADKNAPRQEFTPPKE